MPPRNIYIILSVTMVSLICHFKAAKHRDAAVVGDALALIDQYYVDDVDKQRLLSAAMRGLTSELDDYTAYIPPGAFEQFQDVIQQEFAGIGILINKPADGEPVRVVTPLVGSPAVIAGFLPGDDIVAVGGTDTSKATIEDVSKLLRGPIGSEIKVTVRRTSRILEGESQMDLDLVVERKNIQLDSVAGDHRDLDDSWVYEIEEAPGVAYVRLSGFGERTTREFETVLKQLDNKFDGLILDLRGNAGGLLSSAVDVCDMFLDRGRIVSTRGRGILQHNQDPETVVEEAVWDASSGTLVDRDRPLVVLIDGDSASAAEIVAACLKDQGRATIVGTRSFGKGSVQNVFPLENGRSALKLTTARYYRPSGQNIHRDKDATVDDDWGVSPSSGFEVSVSDEVRKGIFKRWEQATYPAFVTTDQAIDGTPNAVEQVDPTLEDVDPQLFRGIQAIGESGSKKTAPETIKA